MRLLRIRIENFMAHRESDIDCSQFRSALIIGRINDDPRESNGVGKSTIFRAIVFALYGESDLKLERIVRRGGDKCSVLLEFEINGSNYRVVRKRFRKNNKAELELWIKGSIDWENISHRTTSQTEEDLAKLIRISSVAFQHSVLFAQNSVAGLASATSTERKRLLKEPFHLSVYGKYEKVAKEKTTALSKELDKLRVKIDGLGNPEESIVEFKQQLTDINLNVSKSEEIVLKYTQDLDVAKLRLSDLQKIRQEDHSTLKTQYTGSLKELEAFNRKVNDIRTILDKDERKATAVSVEIKSSKDALVILEKSLSDCQSKQLRGSEAVRGDIDKMVSKEIDGKTLISKLKLDCENYKLPLPDGSTCEHCRQTISADHRAACNLEREEKLKAINSDIAKYNTMLGTVVAKKIAFERELKSLDEHKSALQKLETQIRTKKTEIDHNNQLLLQIEETVSSRKKELETAISSRDDLLKQSNELAEQLKAVADDTVKKDIAALNYNISDLEEKLSGAKTELNSLTISIGSLNEKIKNKEDDKNKLAGLIDDLAKVEKEFRLRAKVQQAFSPFGIPTMIINTILDDLQIEANDLLAQLGSGIELLFQVSKTDGDGNEKDTLDIVYRINGEEFEWKELSGGKQMMVSLCLKLALSLIIQRRVNVSIKFLMLDEVESQFDDKTKEAFLSLIKKWQENYTIFVVTHNNRLKDKFNHAILVEGDNVNDVAGRLVSSW